MSEGSDTPHPTSQNSTDVRFVTELRAEDLSSLIADEICVLVVKGFADVALCEKLVRFLNSYDGVEEYTHEVYEDEKVKHLYLGVDRIGCPFNSTFTPRGSDEARLDYYRNVLRGIRRVRRACSPLLSPIDRLRLELDEIWDEGANVAAFEGKKMFVGIVRLMRAELSGASEEHPHFDALPEHCYPLDGQFAANIFLSMPEEGGEFETWKVAPLAPGFTPPLSGAEWRTALPNYLSVRPELGSLIIFNSRRPHAIRKFASGFRASLQCFIGYRRKHPLLMWN